MARTIFQRGTRVHTSSQSAGRLRDIGVVRVASTPARDRAGPVGIRIAGETGVHVAVDGPLDELALGRLEAQGVDRLPELGLRGRLPAVLRVVERDPKQASSRVVVGWHGARP